MFKIGYLPLSKVNWTNDTLEAARANAIAWPRVRTRSSFSKRSPTSR